MQLSYYILLTHIFDVLFLLNSIFLSNTFSTKNLSRFYSPEIHVPFHRTGVSSSVNRSWILNRLPLTLGPSSGGVRRTTEVTMRASTATITRSAMRMPLQLRWFGPPTTNFWKQLEHVQIILEFSFSFMVCVMS